jgi:hypothetical protein
MVCLKKPPRITVLKALATLRELHDNVRVSAVRKWLWNGIQWIQTNYKEEITREKKAILAKEESL